MSDYDFRKKGGTSDLLTSEPTKANTQWLDTSVTPPQVMLFDGTDSIIVGKPTLTRSIQEVANGVPNDYWQSSYAVSGVIPAKMVGKC